MMKKRFPLYSLILAGLLSLSAPSMAAESEGKSDSETPRHPRYNGITLLQLGGGHDIIYEDVIDYYHKHRHRDYQGTQAPKFLVASPNGRTTFTIGGFVNMRTAYDMDCVMPNLDFIPSVIPMQKTQNNLQRVLMDASISRIFMEAVHRTGCGKPLTAYVEGDFRGVNNAFHLRQAYISYAGFKFGQSTSTFTDLNSSFRTIDFEGPNAYTYRRNLMIQYTHSWWNGLSLGAAIEYPEVSATFGQHSNSVYQRVPDIPAYVQYQWGRTDNMSHLRLSGVVRNMFYVDQTINTNIDQIGWGVQLSGAFGMDDWGKLYGQALYGSGVGSYVADLMGMGYDMMPDSEYSGKMTDVPVMAWFLGMQFNITDKMPLTLGYSQVSVFDSNHNLSMGDYRYGQYVAANCFYDCNSWFSFGVEYLYGTRNEFGGGFGRSHRVQTAVQFNF